MKLDVGCGSNPTGDVNCDLFISDVGHRCQEGSPSFDAKRIKNFVICNVTQLPFRENSFDEVYSNHVLEHLLNPCRCLDEMVRVSHDKVVVYVPHRFGDRMLWWQTNPHHVSFFNKKMVLQIPAKKKPRVWHGQIHKLQRLDVHTNNPTGNRTSSAN